MHLVILLKLRDFLTLHVLIEKLFVETRSDTIYPHSQYVIIYCMYMYKIFRFNFAIEYLEKDRFYEKIIRKLLKF